MISSLRQTIEPFGFGEMTTLTASHQEFDFVKGFGVGAVLEEDLGEDAGVEGGGAEGVHGFAREAKVEGVD